MSARLDALVLPKLLRYEPETGRLFWLSRDRSWFTPSRFKTSEEVMHIWNTQFADREALTAINGTGYRTGSILGVPVKAHRVAWAMMTGEWPQHEIDHIDHDRANNKWDNLRHVTYRENRKNMSLFSCNRLGFPGIVKRKVSYEVTLVTGGVRHYIGRFKTVEQAISARIEAQRRFGHHENHGARSIGNSP